MRRCPTSPLFRPGSRASGGFCSVPCCRPSPRLRSRATLMSDNPKFHERRWPKSCNSSPRMPATTRPPAHGMTSARRPRCAASALWQITDRNNLPNLDLVVHDVAERRNADHRVTKDEDALAVRTDTVARRLGDVLLAGRVPVVAVMDIRL